MAETKGFEPTRDSNLARDSLIKTTKAWEHKLRC